MSHFVPEMILPEIHPISHILSPAYRAFLYTAAVLWVIAFVDSLVRVLAGWRRRHEVKVGVLDYSWGWHAFVAAGWLVFILGLGADVGRGRRPDASAMVFVTLLLGWLHLEFSWVRILFDEQGITTRSPWRRSRQVPWAEVKKVSYNAILQWHVIATRGHGKIRMHDYLSGIPEFLEELGTRRPRPRKRRRSQP